MEVNLESVFASRKIRGSTDTGRVIPGAFQVSAKIDEESRKDNTLVLSFLLTLSDPKSLVTYEFRGSCAVTGSPTDFDGMMEVAKDSESRLPRILDAIYQRVYPAVFMLAGLTSSPYPQSTTLGAESIAGYAAEQDGFEATADGGNGDARPSPRRSVHKVKRKAAEKPEEQKPVPVETVSAETTPKMDEKPTVSEPGPVGAPALPQGL